MAKDQKDQATASPAPVEQVRLSLNDFCARLSVTVRRPELIGAFESAERSSGRKLDTESAFRARYDAFINKPV